MGEACRVIDFPVILFNFPGRLTLPVCLASHSNANDDGRPDRPGNPRRPFPRTALPRSRTPTAVWFIPKTGGRF
jgi:hypothetical protein